jgi:hypothetical protein
MSDGTENRPANAPVAAAVPELQGDGPKMERLDDIENEVREVPLRRRRALTWLLPPRHRLPLLVGSRVDEALPRGAGV